MVDLESSKTELVVETHLFTTMRYKNEADNGFSGNIALLIEAIQHSEKVLDEDLKILAKGILSSVIKHKIIVHDTEEIKKAYKQKQEDDEKKKQEEDNSACSRGQGGETPVIENNEISVEN